MKILLITTEPPLKDDEVVSGNAIRARQLVSALEGAGHAVHQSWLCAERSRPEGSFRNRDELQGVLTAHGPDVIIVAYWELLGLLPSELTQAVILDYVAPRSLEELFESPETVRGSMRRLRLNLERCDAVMVGNEQQGKLLINTLVEAGFDLRKSIPVLVVPLGADVAGPPRSSPVDSGWQMVAGGVSWPWRQAGTYAEKLEQAAKKFPGKLNIVQFGGSYRWHEQDPGATRQDQNAVEQAPDPGTPAIDHRGLLPYEDFTRFLSDTAHMGIELAGWNLERQFSQSFRSLEFLRHGLPLLCNDYLPIAKLIERFDAGWTVSDPEALPGLIEEIITHPEQWQKKSQNALQLVREALQPSRSVEPLLKWLESPRKADRLPRQSAIAEKEPVLGVPPLGKRLKRQFGLVRQVLIGRLFGGKKGKGVLFVTRSDLFPVDHGAAVRTVETARALSRRGLEVGIVTDDRKQWYRFSNGQEEPVAYPFWVRLLSLPGPLAKLLHFSKNLPFSNSFLYMPLTDGGFQWRILAATRQVHAEILQAEFPAYALPCIRLRPALDCRVVLVEHNVEYDRIRAQVSELDDTQYENLKEIELSLCQKSDAVVCVSDNDRQKLGEDGVAAERMLTIPHGVNLKSYDAAPIADGRSRFGIPQDAPVLVYHGTFSYPPNREALRIFAEDILPGLERKGVLCHVLAVGRNPPASSPHERIHFTGSVTDVAPWLKVADMAVIPLTDGGGTRMKIIDCFAASLPVISTSKGIEGIPVVSGQHALVLDDWDSINQAICELIENPDRASKLARCGRKMAESLDWDEIAGRYISLYARLA